MDSHKAFRKFHDKKTGFRLKDEQVSGEADEFKGMSKAQILAEAHSHDAKSKVAKKMKTK